MRELIDSPTAAPDGGQTSEQLFPLVYDELRRLAAQRLAWERPGQTLQPTALGHEAYLRLTADAAPPRWDSPGHFFAAAAEAMRRILVENARRKQSVKRGGAMERRELNEELLPEVADGSQLAALDEALDELERHDALSAQLVKLRYFAGLDHKEAAEALEISRRQADRLWVVAKAWLFKRIQDK
jgi:RNA polymerase sigma factor (TIGR02999 family)